MNDDRRNQKCNRTHTVRAGQKATCVGCRAKVDHVVLIGGAL